MATFGQWVEGARPRTLPAAVAPVIVGTAAAYYYLVHVLDLRGWFAYSPLSGPTATFTAVDDGSGDALDGQDEDR